MNNKKDVKISAENWKKLVELKLKFKLKTMDEVLTLLLEKKTKS